MNSALCPLCPPEPRGGAAVECDAVFGGLPTFLLPKRLRTSLAVVASAAAGFVNSHSTLLVLVQAFLVSLPHTRATAPFSPNVLAI